MTRGRTDRDAVTPLSCDDRDANRFLLDLARAAGILPDRIALAVSGGPDSMAMFALATAALPGRIVVATVDHGLRPGSADEAEMVARHCADVGVPHATLVPTAPITGASLQARAREARYALLARWAAAQGAGLIATAHHADDQLETLIMRLNRGAGVAGLAGVRATSGRIVRPLLGWRHEELVALVMQQGIAPVDDPSNVSDRFDRARLRKSLAGVDWLDVDRVGASARALGDAEDAIGWMVTRLEGERCVTGDDGVTLRPDDLPFELLRRLTARAIRRIDPDADVRGPALVRTVQALGVGGRATIGDVLCESNGREWRFSPAPPRRSPR